MAYGLEKQEFIASGSNETEIPFSIWLKINKKFQGIIKLFATNAGLGIIS